MAKLSGVKTVDMVGGEITKVAYGGAIYAKVGDAPQAGDVMLETTGGYDVTCDAFYEIIELDGSNDPRFYDDAGDRNGVSLDCTNATPNVYYRKVAVVSQPFAEMVVSRVEAVEQRMDAVEAKLAPNFPQFNEGDRVKALTAGEFRDIKAGEYGVIGKIFEDDSDPYFIRVNTDDNYDYFRPQDLELAPESETLKEEATALRVGAYAKVISLAGGEDITQIGDIVEITEASVDFYYYRVLRNGKSCGMYSKRFVKATEAEVAAATAPPKPATGDIVIITANTNISRNKVGDIGKISECRRYEAQVEVVGGPRNSNWSKFSEMRLATPAEIAEYDASVKQAELVAQQAAKDSVFTKAGREPNEYRKGDIGRITDTKGAHGYSEGDIVEVNEDFGGTTVVDAVHLNDGYIVCIEIVCFAEDRVDAKEVAC